MATNHHLTSKTHTILGAGGIIGTLLARELQSHSAEIRLAGRHPKKVNPTDHAMVCDLLNSADVEQAVNGSKVAYLTVGLPYSSKIWEEQWPAIMNNVITACTKHNTSLVFFDNVYMYGEVTTPMTEETPINPCSRKGKVRAQIAEMLLSAVKEGKIKALIARSADFYGPGATNTPWHDMLFKAVSEGKAGTWIGDADQPHSMTHVRDAAKAVALLGTTDEDVWNQIWHLPTVPNPLTGCEIVKLATKTCNAPEKPKVLKPWLMKIAGVFSPMIREVNEMLYQNLQPYIFDSTKFSSKFFSARSYEQGVEESMMEFKK